MHYHRYNNLPGPLRVIVPLFIVVLILGFIFYSNNVYEDRTSAMSRKIFQYRSLSETEKFRFINDDKLYEELTGYYNSHTWSMQGKKIMSQHKAYLKELLTGCSQELDEYCRLTSAEKSKEEPAKFIPKSVEDLTEEYIVDLHKAPDPGIYRDTFCLKWKKLIDYTSQYAPENVDGAFASMSLNVCR
jgi:hypothetical protein